MRNGILILLALGLIAGVALPAFAAVENVKVRRRSDNLWWLQSRFFFFR